MTMDAGEDETVLDLGTTSPAAWRAMPRSMLLWL